MLSLDEAITQLEQAARSVDETREVDLSVAANRVLSEDVVSGVSVPPADNSAMDGYAFCAADVQAESPEFSVSQRIAAGYSPQPLERGTAVRIFTGAEIPAGADTVVMQENCEAGPDKVIIRKVPDSGANIRRCGQDVQSGAVILQRGHRLRAQDCGLLASVGMAKVPVFRRLKVAIISNGDELAEPGEALQPGQIYNSNRYLLRSLMQGWGFNVIDLGIAPDDRAAISSVFQSAARQADVMVSTGGVSVGEEDHIKGIVEELGRLDLWRIAVKPGKPLAFGEVCGTPFIGLPGNPASVWVTCLTIARHFLLRSQGVADTRVQPFKLSAQFQARGSSRQTFLRAKQDGASVNTFPNQSSGVLLSASWGDGLVVQRPQQDITNGDSVDFLPYAHLI